MSVGPVFAVVGACAVLFGASYAGAELTGEDAGGRAQPTPAAQPAQSPVGKSLALNGVDRLPDLGRRPRPKPEPKPEPAAVAPEPAPAPAPPPAKSGPAPDPAPTPPADSGPPPADSAPTPVNNQPTPAPSQPAAPTDFYDSDG